jgi:hypothetical protein
MHAFERSKFDLPDSPRRETGAQGARGCRDISRARARHRPAKQLGSRARSRKERSSYCARCWIAPAARPAAED